MSVRKATIGAIAFSGTTLLVCLFTISNICYEIRSIWSELDTEMDDFNILADELWKDLVKLGAGTPSNRQRRQTYGGYSASGSAPNGYGGGGLPVPAPSVPGLQGGEGPNIGSGPQLIGGGCPSGGAGCCSMFF